MSTSVSVIVASNRLSPHLREALLSVHQQTHPPHQVILVNDGHPDNSFFNSFMTDGLATHYVRQQPLGVSIARNTGAATATGSYLAFLDDDDRWPVDRLERQVAAMQTEPKVVLSYCDVHVIDATGHLLFKDVQRQGSVAEMIRRDVGVMLPNSLIQTEAFRRAGGFSPPHLRAQDFDLILSLSKLGPFLYTPGTHVDYRSHDANATRAHREVAFFLRNIAQAHLGYARHREDPSVIAAYRDLLQKVNRFAAWSAARSARQALRERDLRASASEVLWAAQFAPRAPVSWARKRLSARRSQRVLQSLASREDT